MGSEEEDIFTGEWGISVVPAGNRKGESRWQGPVVCEEPPEEAVYARLDYIGECLRRVISLLKEIILLVGFGIAVQLMIMLRMREDLGNTLLVILFLGVLVWGVNRALEE